MSSIVLDNVTVDFPIYDGARRSFRHAILQLTVGGTVSHRGRGHLDVRALDGISLTIAAGDRVGLVGHNGAGKSSLLRLLAGLREPSSGSVQVQGRATAILSLGSILDGEMTGYENIDRARLLLDLPRRMQATLTEDVESFTELGMFLNLPVKTYSAGMQLRLSFALMTAQHPEILLLDEVMGAGDSQFRIKAENRMRDIKERAEIMVIASHANEEIRRVCNKVAWLEHGRLQLFGPTHDVLAAYEASTQSTPP